MVKIENMRNIKSFAQKGMKNNPPDKTTNIKIFHLINFKNKY